MNDHFTRKGKPMAAETQDNLNEAQDLLGKAERSLARLSRRLPILVKSIIASGDAEALGALKQIEMQALSYQAPGDAYLTIVRLHQQLYTAAEACGLEAPTPPGDDDIVVQSSGR